MSSSRPGSSHVFSLHRFQRPSSRSEQKQHGERRWVTIHDVCVFVTGHTDWLSCVRQQQQLRPAVWTATKQTDKRQVRWATFRRRRCSSRYVKHGGSTRPPNAVAAGRFHGSGVCYRRRRWTDQCGALIKRCFCRSETGGGEYANLCGIYMRRIMSFS